MKITKHVNHHTLVAKLIELNGYSTILQGDLKKIISLFDDTKLGITELNYQMEEPIMQLRNTYAKIEDLLRGI